MNIEYKDLKKLLHAATGNVRDFVMDNDVFINDFLNELKYPKTISNIDAIKYVKSQLRGLLMKWFNEGKESHGKMAISEYPLLMINRDVDNFAAQFKEQKQADVLDLVLQDMDKQVAVLSQQGVLNKSNYTDAVSDLKICVKEIKEANPTPQKQTV